MYVQFVCTHPHRAVHTYRMYTVQCGRYYKMYVSVGGYEAEEISGYWPPYCDLRSTRSGAPWHPTARSSTSTNHCIISRVLYDLWRRDIIFARILLYLHENHQTKEKMFAHITISDVFFSFTNNHTVSPGAAYLLCVATVAVLANTMTQTQTRPAVNALLG